MKWSMLYKKTKTGKIQTWEISTDGNKIITKFGQLGGKIQITEDAVSLGKSIGTIAETTPTGQAQAEAAAKYTKQLKDGYVEDISMAENNEVNKEFVLGGIEPMLAKIYEDEKDNLHWPVMIQPKLDGCLHGSSKITTDLGIKTLADIVDNKIQCKVLSYNMQTKTEEFKDITNWFDNDLAHYTEWYYIKLSPAHFIKCTGNHKIFTNNGWKRADELDENLDKILANRGEDRLFSLLVGTLLGDATICIDKRTKISYRISFGHANKDLLDFKIKLLNLNGKKSEVTSGHGSDIHRFVSEALTYSDKRVITGSGKFLTFSTKDTLYLLNLLTEFQCKGVEYKYYFPTNGYIPLNENNYEFHNFHVCKSRRNIPQKKYDIEVEGNHNYFANKILVHNCRTVAEVAIKNEEVTCNLWSRTRKPITSCPHIQEEILEAIRYNDLFNDDIILYLDGELYLHSEDADNFEEIISAVRQEDPSEASSHIQFWCYDVFITNNPILSFNIREDFRNIIKSCEHVVIVPTEQAWTFKQVDDLWKNYTDQGYEGVMVRDAVAPYQHKRTRDLLKYKKFRDAEYKIVGFNEGRGKLKGCLATFVCVDEKGVKFKAKPKMSNDTLKDMWSHKEDFIGKMLTVQYFSLTNKNHVPRLPVGIRIRDDAE